MALPVIQGQIYVEDTGLSTSNQTRLQTTLGGTTTIDNVDEVGLGTISKINTAVLSDIGVIDEIDFRTAGSDILYFHTENHSSFSGYETLSTSSADAARTTYTGTGNDTDTYPIWTLAEEFATETTYTEVVPGETWTWYVRKKCIVGCSSSTYGGYYYCYVYKRDSGGTETLLSTHQVVFGTTTEGTGNSGATVTTELNGDYIVCKLWFYMYELGDLV